MRISDARPAQGICHQDRDLIILFFLYCPQESGEWGWCHQRVFQIVHRPPTTWICSSEKCGLLGMSQDVEDVWMLVPHRPSLVSRLQDPEHVLGILGTEASDQIGLLCWASWDCQYSNIFLTYKNGSVIWFDLMCALDTWLWPSSFMVAEIPTVAFRMKSYSCSKDQSDS